MSKKTVSISLNDYVANFIKERLENPSVYFPHHKEVKVTPEGMKLLRDHALAMYRLEQAAGTV